MKISKYFIAFHLLHFHRILIAIFQYVRISLQINRIQKNLFVCNLFAMYCNKNLISSMSDYDHIMWCEWVSLFLTSVIFFIKIHYILCLKSSLGAIFSCQSFMHYVLRWWHFFYIFSMLISTLLFTHVSINENLQEFTPSNI